MTHGGFGYAKEFHVERYLRESLIPRIAPISPQLILSFIAEKVLGLPKLWRCISIGRGTEFAHGHSGTREDGTMSNHSVSNRSVSMSFITGVGLTLRQA